MSHSQINNLFSSYINTLYIMAKRLIDKRHAQYEDKVQDLVILAYEEFMRNAVNGKIMQLPLIIHFMKLRKPEVQMEMRGYSKTKKTDIFNKRNYFEGRLELHSIHNSVSGSDDDSYLEVVPNSSNLELEIIQKIDTEQILNRLSFEERQVVEMKSSGFNVSEISSTLHLKRQTVNHTLEKLKSTFENRSIHQLEINLLA